MTVDPPKFALCYYGATAATNVPAAGRAVRATGRRTDHLCVNGSKPELPRCIKCSQQSPYSFQGPPVECRSMPCRMWVIS